MQVCIKFISRTIHHEHVSIVVETIFMVTYRNISYANSLSKSTSEPLDVTRNALNYLRSLDIYTPCVLCNLLFGPTKAQYINNSVCIVKYPYTFQSIYVVFREFLIVL